MPKSHSLSSSFPNSIFSRISSDPYLGSAFLYAHLNAQYRGFSHVELHRADLVTQVRRVWMQDDAARRALLDKFDLALVSAAEFNTFLRFFLHRFFLPLGKFGVSSNNGSRIFFLASSSFLQTPLSDVDMCLLLQIGGRFI